MLEAHLTSLWKPTDERAFPSPSEKDKTRAIIGELQRELDAENSIIELTTKVLAEHQRRARRLEGELQKRKLYIAPVRTVPDDLLADMLALALARGHGHGRGRGHGRHDDYDRRQIWRLSHVCRRWRRVCLASASLWSRIEVDLAVDRPFVGLVQRWRERAWATKQTIVLRLCLEQFGALRGMCKGGVKYITHLRLIIPAVAIAPPRFNLPPALPCLRHLSLVNDAGHYPLNYIEAKVYITSLCHRLFARRQTRCNYIPSPGLFHLEFRNLAFDKPLRVLNRVHTLVLRKCTFAGPLLILQFLEAARYTLKHFEYTDCWTQTLEELPSTRPVAFLSLLTLTHNSPTPNRFSILSILSCPTLTALTIDVDALRSCTVAHFPGLKELCLVRTYLTIGKYPNSPLVRDSIHLETLTVSDPFENDDISSMFHAKNMLSFLQLADPSTFTPSLRCIRVHFRRISDAIEGFESGFQAIASNFTKCGRDVKIELIRGELDRQ
jgi:F-box-like